MSNSYKFYSDTKDIMKKYVNATEGAIIYGISKSRIMVLASEAGAVYKVGNSALINTDMRSINKTKQVDEQGKPIYQDVCYPVTKDFREKLYNEIISEYEKAKDKSNEKARESAEKHHGNPDKEKDKEATPFR